MQKFVLFIIIFLVLVGMAFLIYGVFKLLCMLGILERGSKEKDKLIKKGREIILKSSVGGGIMNNIKRYPCTGR